MRIPKTWVKPLTEKIIGKLVSEGQVEPSVPMDTLIAESEAIIVDELMVEDRLNDEVRGLLKKYESDIEKGRLDYRTMFDLTKHKLARERNLVL